MKLKLFTVVVMAMAFFAAGCGQYVTLKLEPGYTDTISYSKVSDNRIWVEMKDKEPSETGSRNSTLEYIVNREILALEDDGAVLVKLTFNKVALSVTNVSGATQKNSYYTSEIGSTKSSWPGEPSLAGRSLTAKVYPDSRVVFNDLDELRLSMRLTENDNSTVASLIREKNLKDVLQRSILLSCPKGNISAKSWDEFLPTPDPMLNAKAIRKIYSLAGKDEAGNFLLKTEIEPLYVLPDGVEHAPAGDPFRQVLKDNSDLQDPVVESKTIIEAQTGIVLADNLKVNYLMIVDGNKLFPDQQRPNANTDAGMMFIEIIIDEKYEITR